MRSKPHFSSVTRRMRSKPHFSFVTRRMRSVSQTVKMSTPIDLELKKAFGSLQMKMIDTQQKAKMADLQIEQLSRVSKHAKLTHNELTTLTDNTRLYEGVGRMFILQSKEEINNQLMDKQKTADDKIKELEQKKVYLERSVKEAEDNIREMLLSRRQ